MKRPTLAALAVLATMIAPAGASAATVNVDAAGGFPVVKYRAAAGEVNAVKMNASVGPSDLRMPFFEFAAQLEAGGGCVAGFPTICGQVQTSFPIEASLGDRSDVAYINTFVNDATLDAGSGSDDVLVGGYNATGDGGYGADTLTVAASSAARGNGGAGNDRVTGGLGAVAAILTGGTGRDLLVPDGSQFDTATGGSGGDRLVSFTGHDVTLTGESGTDTLVIAGGSEPRRRVLNGGSGTDLVYNHLGSATIDGGSGSDVIDVRGGDDTPADTVACGSGFDLVWADRGDNVADDCELVLHDAAPTLPPVAGAISAAQALIAHRPDPSAL
jgi:Ca2+-binding RTX toxin-like protein